MRGRRVWPEVEGTAAAHVELGGRRRTVLWSTLPEYDVHGHRVVKLDPDVPPIGIVACECAECGATVWPIIHVYRGWMPKAWLRPRAQNVRQTALLRLEAQAERLRPGLHAVDVDVDGNRIHVVMSDGQGEPERVTVY